MGVRPGGRKSKGSKAERELIHMFWENDFAAMRAAGSGSSQSPSPDVIAGNGKIFLAIECKASHKRVKYLDKDEITQLDLFANTFGARPYIAVRFDNDVWHFLRLTDLKVTSKCYVVNDEIVKKKSLSFAELIGKYEQKKLDSIDS